MVRRLLKRLLGHRNDPVAPGPQGRIPDGERIYAIGDIHGRCDLLRKLHAAIAADGSDAEGRQTVVYLGDFIDRGMESRQVIDLLLQPPDDGLRRVHLLGNHEAMLLAFLQSARGAGAWLANGGGATLHSYGVTPPANYADPNGLAAARQALQDHLPADHLTFFQNLRLCYESGDYFFVHAGVRPGTPLHQQVGEDMIWIREAFLDANDDFTKIIVHGHSIRAEPEECHNRIGIDTGAYMSGTLTALVLENDQRRYLST